MYLQDCIKRLLIKEEDNILVLLNLLKDKKSIRKAIGDASKLIKTI